ncbi:MAG TPA: SUMF1/EgtB/PvdO family nonheme iron enzyme [Verrucomicrobiota bacterium]|nr:SUMF1/EgtB/PvdO family nonheme iron enzyme [Verrucomicrobiota bacterium]
MRSQVWPLVGLGLLLGVAAAQDRPIVAVFDLEVKGTKLDKGTIDRLTDYLGTLLTTRGYQVVPRSQLKERLTSAKKQSYKECFDQSCQIEVGKELAAQKSLASQVLKIGKQCKVTVNLFDLKKSASEAAGAATGDCGEDGVVLALEHAVEAMLGKAVPGQAGGRQEPGGAKTPDLSEYERLAAQAQAEEAKRLEAEKKAQAERARHLASLERAWEAVKKVAGTKGITLQARAGVVRKFLGDFGRENPHEGEAQGLLARLDKGEEPGGGAELEWILSKPAGIEFTKTEVTVGQYRACVEAGKCSASATNEGCNFSQAGRDQHPVNCVDWNQATTFCDWTGGRLPTEQEWEAEASEGGKRQYPWGDQEVSCDRAIWRQAGNGCGKDSTWPVCSKPAGNSVSGLCDLSGNVWEWTSSGEGAARVVRGGAWPVVNPGGLRASVRDRIDPANRVSHGGFRCGRSSR